MWPTAPSRGFSLQANKESRVAAKEVLCWFAPFLSPLAGLGTLRVALSPTAVAVGHIVSPAERACRVAHA
jgi:hypothetical protein